MDSANYILAHAILAERRRDAEHRRLIAELKAAQKSARGASRGSGQGRWSLEWGGNGFTGKPVTLVNTATGETVTARDHGNWDKAMGRALRVAATEAPRELVGTPTAK